MLDSMFSFVDLFVEPLVEPTEEDVSRFIASLEALFETPEQFKADVVLRNWQGSAYELHRMLDDLKSDSIDFKTFLEQAAGWSKAVNDQAP